MGIHLMKLEDGGLFDNQIRTHGSVDYTSIARRFSHGCHRLVNNRAVRLFDFVLRHRKFARLGNMPLPFQGRFEVRGRRYEYALTTRGYYYELRPPVPVNVLEGRVLGAAKKPITAVRAQARRRLRPASPRQSGGNAAGRRAMRGDVAASTEELAARETSPVSARIQQGRHGNYARACLCSSRTRIELTHAQPREARNGSMRALDIAFRATRGGVGLRSTRLRIDRKPTRGSFFRTLRQPPSGRN